TRTPRATTTPRSGTRSPLTALPTASPTTTTTASPPTSTAPTRSTCKWQSASSPGPRRAVAAVRPPRRPAQAIAPEPAISGITESKETMMRHLPGLRLPAPARGRPRPRSRVKVRAAIAVAALFALALMGLSAAGPAARAATEGPYGGTAAAVPGAVFAENYDTGGQGVAYNVTSVNGTDNGYRSDGVDLETTTDTGWGDDLGWTAAGQWFKYTVEVATA